MKREILIGYIISVFFVFWSFFKGNYEFIAYAVAVVVILGLLHYFDRQYDFNKWMLWGFDAWIVMHIIGGLFTIGGKAVYSWVIIPIVGEPYFILKYDQVVHAYCYFIFALLVWSVVRRIADKKAPFSVLAFLAVMTAAGIGGLNEMIEFGTTLFFANNVGGYENTAIDIVSNLVGALLAVPLFRKLK